HSLSQQNLGGDLGQGKRVGADQSFFGAYLGPEDHVLVQKEIQQRGSHPGGDAGGSRQERAEEKGGKKKAQQGKTGGIDHGADQRADGIPKKVGQNQLVNPPGIVDIPEVRAFVFLDVSGADLHLVKGNSLVLEGQQHIGFILK